MTVLLPLKVYPFTLKYEVLRQLYVQTCHQNNLSNVAGDREKHCGNDIFLGQGKSQVNCDCAVKFRKDLKSQGKHRKFES